MARIGAHCSNACRPDALILARTPASEYASEKYGSVFFGAKSCRGRRTASRSHVCLAGQSGTELVQGCDVGGGDVGTLLKNGDDGEGIVFVSRVLAREV